MSGNISQSWPVVIIRTVVLGFIFILGCVCISSTQWMGFRIFKNSAHYQQSVINLTKVHFVTLLTFIASVVVPCKISITSDPTSMPKSNSFKVDLDGHLRSILTPNSVFISNHQIYTDWLFIWFLNYTARLGDCIHIVLKDLSNIPVLGYGMKNYNFLFLSRKWEKDKITMTNQLLNIDANARGSGPANGVKHISSTNVRASDEFGKVKHWPKQQISSQVWPYTVMIYPEGTVTSTGTKERSLKFCQSRNLPPLKHVLLPRTRGLLLILRKLRRTVEVVYDITTGYSGLKEDEFGEEKFTLKQAFIFGNGPACVNYYIRAWNLKDIPLGEDSDDFDDVNEEDLARFEKWLFDVWYHKDKLMDSFFKTGKFVDPNSPGCDTIEKAEKNTVVADFKIRHPSHAIAPFLPEIAALLLLRLFWMFVRFAISKV